MAAIFSGTRSLNLACFERMYAIPRTLAIRTSLRVQQILAYETGWPTWWIPWGLVTHVSLDRRDGGEDRRDDREDRKRRRMVKLIESGSNPAGAGAAELRLADADQLGEKILVGVNKFKVKEEERDLENLQDDPETINRQLQRLAAVKASRRWEKSRAPCG